MLQIQTKRQSVEAVELAIAGHLTDDGVTVLEKEGNQQLQQCGHLVIDLSGTRFIDRAGLALLQRWTKEGRLTLRRPTRFIRVLLARNGLHCAEGGLPQ